MKHYDYVITTKIPDYSQIDRISQILLFIAIIVFVFTGLQNWPATSSSSVIRLAAAAFIAVYWLYCRIMSNRKDRVTYYRLGFSIAVIGWLTLYGVSVWAGVIAVFYLIAAFLERQVKFPEEIGVDTTGITFNSFPKKHHSWNELNNLLLKDSIITVDYKNNKIYQKEIESDVSDEIEKEFNQFCSKQIKG